MNTKLEQLFTEARGEVFVKLGTEPHGISKADEMLAFGTKIVDECLAAVKDDAHAVQLIKSHFNITS